MINPDYVLTPDYFFSYWIFIWYLFYITGIFTQYNPKISIILSIIMTFYNIYVIIYYKYYYMLFLYLTIIFFIKILPLITLLNTSFKFKDFLFGFYLFLLYCLWITIYYKKNVINLIYSIYINNYFIKNNDINQSLIMVYLDKFINIFFNTKK